MCDMSECRMSSTKKGRHGIIVNGELGVRRNELVTALHRVCKAKRGGRALGEVVVQFSFSF